MNKDYIAHVGVSILDGAPGRGSGRYPLGSGENPYQRPADFMTRVNKMKAEGKSESEICKELGIIDYAEKKRRLKAQGKTAEEIELLLHLPDEKDKAEPTRLRAYIAIENHRERSQQVAKAVELRDKGMSLRQIAKEMGFANESSVRSLLDEDIARRKEVSMGIADKLREEVDKYGMIDVGKGVPNALNISAGKLKEACYILEDEGYHIYSGGVPQPTNKNQSTHRLVLTKPEYQHKDIYNYDQIHLIDDCISHDGGQTLEKFIYPASMDSKRLKVRYAEEGGLDKDGVVEIRRGVKDLSLGDSHYSQVRILVDGTHYIKGMAVYSDAEDWPDGVDVIFNTNKPKGTPALGPDKNHTVLKPIKKDPEDPFGSLIKAPSQGGQSFYDDPNGNYISADGKKQSLSLINKRADEGDWSDWSNKLPSQFLAKQPLYLIDRQLNLSMEQTKTEFDEICALTNPTVKKNLLRSFADKCDGTASSLSAAAIPGQRYQVILPISSLKETEVYAPNYKNGTKVALVRFPHGGTFEIPICTVNNKNEEAIKTITPNAKDAVGVNKKVADRLSGADFDGDTVMVLPFSDSISIVSTPQLKGLKDFDPHLEYGGKDEGTYHKMKKKQTQTEMGLISNLIMDMTLKGATEEELTKAVKHSMVVIDAEKHGLDYKLSEKVNDIKELHKKYQGHYDENGKYHEGAATIITKAGSDVETLKRRGSPRIDEKTGKLIYKEVKETFVDDKGKERVRTQKVSRMSKADDARELMSGYPGSYEKEIRYANYANFMKDMAAEARIIIAKNERIKYDSDAAKEYKEEVDHLKAQLNTALKNKPRERQAQALAATRVKEKQELYEEQGVPKSEYRDDLKKYANKAVLAARYETGSKRTEVKISDKEWDAIQAGAISENTLKEILEHANPDRVKQLATPRTVKTVGETQKARILNLQRSGYTNAEIAEAVGVSPSTVTDILSGKE